MADDKHTLRILCIHGYRQSGKAFRERTGAFRKITKKHAELVFIDAPNKVPPPEDKGDAAAEASEAAEEYGWWFSRANDYYYAQERTDCVKGYQESLDVVTKAFEEQGPFDGVLGFSQGATLVSLLCAIQQKEAEASPYKFNFAILVAGFQSRQVPHEELYSQKISLPTLHVFGDTDKVIPKDMSENLLQYFHEPVILQHPGGHFIPASGPQKKTYLEFLTDMRAKKGSTQT